MHRALLLSLLFSFAWAMPSAHAQASCELTPLTLPLFGGTPLAELATPAASPVAVELSEADAEAVLEMYVACTNTGDPTLIWAMFTPRWFSSEFANSEEHYLPAFEYEIANGQSDVLEPLVLKSVDEIEVLSNGRMAVTATFASGGSEWTDQLILANIDGQWLIDEVLLVSPPA